MSRQKPPPLRPKGLVEWAFLLLGLWAGISVLTQLFAGSRGRISVLDVLIVAAALYWFGIHRGWFQRLKAPSTDTSTEREVLTEEPQAPARETETFEIIVPRSTEWRPSVAASFMKALYDTIGEESCHLSIRATKNSISWLLDCTFTRDSLESFVNQFYPGAQVRPFEYQEKEYPFYRPIPSPIKRRNGQGGERECRLRR
jgi:hypothetical protein